MASYPSEQPNSVRRCNVPTYDDQFSHPHLAGRFSENGAIFQTRQFPSDEVEVEEVIAQESQTQPQAQTTGSGTKEKGKGKASYYKWTNEEHSKSALYCYPGTRQSFIESYFLWISRCFRKWFLKPGG